VRCRLSVSLSSVDFYLNCFSSVGLSLILMKIGMNDVVRMVRKVTE